MTGAMALLDRLPTLRLTAIAVACFTAAVLLAEGMRQIVVLPVAGSPFSMVAFGLAVLVWFAIVLRGRS